MFTSVILIFTPFPVLVSIKIQNFLTKAIMHFNSSDDRHNVDISFFCVLLRLLSEARSAIAAVDDLKKNLRAVEVLFGVPFSLSGYYNRSVLQTMCFMHLNIPFASVLPNTLIAGELINPIIEGYCFFN